jgi:hypothetical protein
MTTFRTSPVSTKSPSARQPSGIFGEGLARIPQFDHRCLDCDVPLVLGKGCSLCPICGRSSCA